MQQLKIFCLNIRSINGNLSELLNFFEYLEFQPEVMFLTEKWQKQSSVFYRFEGYRKFFTQRTKIGKVGSRFLLQTLSLA